VFRPGQGHAIFDRVKTFFGGKAPAKLAVMIDMESGDQFAGPGDHSSGANELAELFAIWLGSRKRVIGYANGGDWANNWPTRPSWLKRFTAAYGTHDPGTFGWQYYGATSDPTLTGYPRSCPPFGSNVDMNVIHQPIGDIVTAFGLTKEFTMTPTEEAKIKAMIDARADRTEAMIRNLFTGHDQKVHRAETLDIMAGGHSATQARAAMAKMPGYVAPK